MEGLRQYILGVTAAAMVCAILCTLVQKTGEKDLIRMLCGVFLTIVLIQPLVKADLKDLPLGDWLQIQEGKQNAAYGEALAKESRLAIIKRRAETYILDKAQELKTELEVEVSLDPKTEMPKKANLSGAVSPYVRKQLSQMMQKELGISTEEQQWTG